VGEDHVDEEAADLQWADGRVREEAADAFDTMSHGGTIEHAACDAGQPDGLFAQETDEQVGHGLLSAPPHFPEHALHEREHSTPFGHCTDLLKGSFDTCIVPDGVF